jgi:hypothetical protein
VSAAAGRARASRHHAAGGAHLGQRALGVAGRDLHAAHSRRVDRDLEALAQRVQRRVLDAVVRGQPDDGDLRDPALAQQLAQARALEAAVARPGP